MEKEKYVIKECKHHGICPTINNVKIGNYKNYLYLCIVNKR